MDPRVLKLQDFVSGLKKQLDDLSDEIDTMSKTQEGVVDLLKRKNMWSDNLPKRKYSFIF